MSMSEKQHTHALTRQNAGQRIKEERELRGWSQQYVASQIVAHFHDGILWAGAGKTPDMIGILSRWGTLLGISPVEAPRLTTPQAWTQAIRAVIGSRQMLIVIDDIWTLEAFVFLKVGGHTCAYVLTTRFPQLAWHAAADGTFPVAELNEADSILFLELHLASEQKYLEYLVKPGNRFAAFLSMRGSYTEAIALLEQVCQAASELQDQQGLTMALYRLGEIAMNKGDYVQAYDSLQRGLALSSQLADLSLRSQLLRLLGRRSILQKLQSVP